MGPPEGRVRTTVLPGCGEGRARAPRPAADGQHMRNRAGRAAKTGSITTDVSGPTGRAWSPATVSAAFMAHAATPTIYARAINLHPPRIAFPDACGTQQVLHLVFVSPFQPFTLFSRWGFPPPAR